MPFHNLSNQFISSQIVALRHKILVMMGHQAVLVYTMGKVGSSTVYHTLRHNRVSPLVYHVHFLHALNIKSIVTKYKKTRHITIRQIFQGNLNHITSSLALSQMRGTQKWFIISLVRDPVATFISHVFQNPQIHRPQLLGQNGKLDKSLVQNYIIDYYANFDSKNDYISNWFDNEFYHFTGIDVYEDQFNPSVGYSILRNDFFNIAIVSLETIEQTLSFAISELLGQEQDLEIVKSNLRSASKEKKLYKEIINHILIPKDFLTKVYATKYARHFFSSDDRRKMSNKWSQTKVNIADK